MASLYRQNKRLGDKWLAAENKFDATNAALKHQKERYEMFTEFVREILGVSGPKDLEAVFDSDDDDDDGLYLFPSNTGEGSYFGGPDRLPGTSRKTLGDGMEKATTGDRDTAEDQPSDG